MVFSRLIKSVGHIHSLKDVQPWCQGVGGQLPGCWNAPRESGMKNQVLNYILTRLTWEGVGSSSQTELINGANFWWR